MPGYSHPAADLSSAEGTGSCPSHAVRPADTYEMLPHGRCAPDSKVQIASNNDVSCHFSSGANQQMLKPYGFYDYSL
jgi:hypothetical protein